MLGQVLKVLVLTLMMVAETHAAESISLKLSESDKARILQLQNPFGEHYLRFVPQGQEPVLLGLKSCQLYRAKLEKGIVTEWMEENALSTFYPWWSGCSQESLKQEGAFIRLTFCKTPLGAGGGCAGGGGDFRSINGVDWQKREFNDKWKNVVIKK